MRGKIHFFLADQRGMATVYVAISLMVLFSFLAISVDLSRWYTVDNELQNAGDSLALAAARAYYPYNAAGLVAINPDPGMAAMALNTYQTDNEADKKTLTQTSNVQYGIWNYLTGTMEMWYWPIELGAFKGPSVSLEFRKEAGLNDGPVQNFFGLLFNRPTTDLRDRSSAALSGVGQVNKGQVDLPLVVGDRYAESTNEITLRPSWSDSGGWTSFFDHSTSAKDMRDLVTHATPSPPLTANVDSINLQNGVDSSVFIQALVPRWQAWQQNHPGEDWVVTLPIVTADSNYVQSRVVLGFASFKITDVQGPPDKIIKVVPLPGRILIGAGGGGRYYGLMSVQPKLVQ
jgi:hypothetical protein